MQGNELCLKAQHMAYSGTWCFNEIRPRFINVSVRRIHLFTKLQKRSKRHAVLCFRQSEDPNSGVRTNKKVCVPPTMNLRMFPSRSKGVNWLWRDP